MNRKKISYILLSIFCLLTLYPVEWDKYLYKAKVLGAVCMILGAIKLFFRKEDNNGKHEKKHPKH